MTNSGKKTKKFNVHNTKENVAKVLAAVGVVGLGAALFAKRNKIKEVVHKLISKAKKSA